MTKSTSVPETPQQLLNGRQKRPSKRSLAREYVGLVEKAMLKIEDIKYYFSQRSAGEASPGAWEETVSS